MGVDMASTYKTTALKQLGLFGKGKGQTGTEARAKAYCRYRQRDEGSRPMETVASRLDDITAVKTLVDRMGAEKVRQLAVVLGK